MKLFRNLTTALALIGFITTASAETVSLSYDFATPQHVFATGDIKAALEAKKMTVEVKKLFALTEKGAGKKGPDRAG